MSRATEGQVKPRSWRCDTLKSRLSKNLMTNFQSCLYLSGTLKYSRALGSRSTFEIPSRVNLCGPSLYCIARTSGKKSRHSIGLAGATRLTRSDFRLNLLLLVNGQGCVYLVFYSCLYIGKILNISRSSQWCARSQHFSRVL